MREALKRLAGESVVYGIGQVSGRAVQLLLVPVLTRVLTPGAYGVSELVLAYLQTALLVLVLGMDSALARFFYQEPSQEARIRMASTSLAYRLATGVVASLALAMLAGPLATQLMGSEVYRKYLLLGALTLPFTLVILFANDVLRVTFQPLKFISLNITNSLVVAGLSLWLVLERGLGVAGVLYAKLAGDALCALLGLVLVRHTLAPWFDRAVLARMLRYGLPLVPAALSYGAMASFDRFVLQKTRSLEEVAVYAVAAKFFAVATMGISAFQMGYMPFAYSRAESPDAPRFYARVFSLFVCVGALGAFAISLFAPEAIALLVPPGYAAAALPAVWLAFAAVAQGASIVGAIGIALALRTPLVAWIAAGSTLATVATNLILTPRLGPVGAAAATWIAHMVSAVITYFVAQRVYPVPYRGAPLLGIVLVALLLALLVQRAVPPGAIGIVAKIAMIAIFGGLIWRSRPWRDHAIGQPDAAPR